MQLEIGKVYKDGRGRLVKVICKVALEESYIFLSRYVDECGQLLEGTENWPISDLIAEVKGL